MVGFDVRRKRSVAMVGLGWWLSLSFLVGFSQSLSTSVSTSVSKGRPHLSAAAAISADSNNKNDISPHYKWLIIGGGIHGVGIAARLVGEGKINLDDDDKNNPRGQLLVVDEHPSLLHSWKERTNATGMAFLRSSVGFHLDIPVQGLKEFAGDYHRTTTASAPQTRKPSKKAQRKAKNNRNKGGNPDNIFVGSDYQRPALKLFNDHCDLVVDKYGLEKCLFRGRVESIQSSSSNNTNDNDNNRIALPVNVVIRTGSDAEAITAVSADNIVLAVGNDDPLFPEWSTDLTSKSKDHKISHLLQISESSETSGSCAENGNHGSGESVDGPRVVAIIGGGISAVHKALQLTSVDNVNNQKTTNDDKTTSVVVHIVSRHPVREQQFDTHQDWMMTDELAKRSLEKGGKGLTERQKGFRTISAPAERREVIKRERIPGTVPTYMTRTKGGLEEAIAAGKIHWHVAGVASAKDENERYKLDLTNGASIAADEIVLATGLGKRPPGHQIIHPLAEEACLPLSPCGYPLVDPSLQWKPRSSTIDGDGGGFNTSSKIFVSGGLAELELGPSARNIAGARMAAERIAAA